MCSCHLFPTIIPWEKYYALLLFHRWRNRVSERLSDLLNVKQLAVTPARIGSHVYRWCSWQWLHPLSGIDPFHRIQLRIFALNHYSYALNVKYIIFSGGIALELLFLNWFIGKEKPERMTQNSSICRTVWKQGWQLRFFHVRWEPCWIGRDF